MAHPPTPPAPQREPGESRQAFRQRVRLARKGRTVRVPDTLMGDRLPDRHKPYTPQQLMVRAVERLRYRKAVEAATGEPYNNRAPHAYRGTAERKHFDRSAKREAAREAFRAGLQKPVPTKHLHSHARQMRALKRATARQAAE